MSDRSGSSGRHHQVLMAAQIDAGLLMLSPLTRHSASHRFETTGCISNGDSVKILAGSWPGLVCESVFKGGRDLEPFARLVRLHEELQTRRQPVSGRVLQERLRCSRATFHRVLARLKDGLGAPVINVPGRGYFYDRSQPRFELPGLWLIAVP